MPKSHLTSEFAQYPSRSVAGVFALISHNFTVHDGCGIAPSLDSETALFAREVVHVFGILGLQFFGVKDVDVGKCPDLQGPSIN